MSIGLLIALAVSAPAAWAAEEEPVDGEEAQEEPAKPKEPPKPYVVPDAEKTRFDVLAGQADPREVLKLTANQEEFLALYRPEHTPKAHGALVILHIEDGHPDWPMVVNPVRTQMPDFGWATLSVAIPSPGPAEIPERTLPAIQVLAGMPKGADDGEEAPAEDEAEGGDEAANEDAPEDAAAEPKAPADEEGDELGEAKDGEGDANADWPPPKPTFVPVEDPGPLADRVDARIDAAVSHLLAQGYEQIVFVGHGVGAVWIMDYLKDHPAPPEQAVVMIQPRMPHRQIDVDLPALLLEQQRPILDLYYDDNRFDKSFATERANFARRSGNPHYRQTRLGGLGLQSGQSEAKDRRVVQSLRGWLDYLYQFEEDEREPADSYIRGPIRSLYEERMERSRY
ncbi:DUF3530 family protein [Oceanospirillum sp. HFRX-1_2]